MLLIMYETHTHVGGSARKTLQLCKNIQTHKVNMT